MTLLRDQLTLICPSHERPKFLERTLRFYSLQESRVIVVDGSKEALRSDVLESPNIYYIHLPVVPSERLKLALSKVTTPYAAFVPDDDFMLPSANKACVDYLDQMPDYVACSGRAMFYEEHPKGVLYREAFPGYRDKDYYQISAKDRLAKFFESYDVFHLWSVIRTSVMKNAIEIGFNSVAIQLMAQEATFEFAVCAQGKSRVLNHLRWMRSRCPQVDWREGASQSNNIYGYNSSNLESERNNLFQYLLDMLPDFLSGMSVDDVSRIYESLNPDTGRHQWFGDVMSFQPSMNFRAKQLIKDMLEYISCPDFFKRNNKRQFSEMRNQLVRINANELDQVKALLSRFPVSYIVQ